MKRRQFIHGTLAAAIAMPGVSLCRGAAAASATLSFAIYDARHADARAFAATSAQLGAVPLPAGGDCVRLCRALLAEYPHGTPMRLAGLTTYSDLVVMRSCAAAKGVKIMYEGLHDCRGGLTLTHTVLRDTGGRNTTAALHPFGGDWAAALARALHGAPLPPLARVGDFALNTTLRTPGHPGTLASWLIA